MPCQRRKTLSSNRKICLIDGQGRLMNCANNSLSGTPTQSHAGICSCTDGCCDPEACGRLSRQGSMKCRASCPDTARLTPRNSKLFQENMTNCQDMLRQLANDTACNMECNDKRVCIHDPTPSCFPKPNCFIEPSPLPQPCSSKCSMKLKPKSRSPSAPASCAMLSKKRSYHGDDGLKPCRSTCSMRSKSKSRSPSATASCMKLSKKRTYGDDNCSIPSCARNSIPLQRSASQCHKPLPCQANKSLQCVIPLPCGRQPCMGSNPCLTPPMFCRPLTKKEKKQKEKERKQKEKEEKKREKEAMKRFKKMMKKNKLQGTCDPACANSNCTCRFPPTFAAFYDCTGHIYGSCSCGNNK